MTAGADIERRQVTEVAPEMQRAQAAVALAVDHLRRGEAAELSTTAHLYVLFQALGLYFHGCDAGANVDMLRAYADFLEAEAQGEPARTARALTAWQDAACTLLARSLETEHRIAGALD